MDFSNIWDSLNGILFGDQREQWEAVDEASRADMLREAGLHEAAPAEGSEAVAMAYDDMPPQQAALLLAPVNQVANVSVEAPAAPAASPRPSRVPWLLWPCARCLSPACP